MLKVRPVQHTGLTKKSGDNMKGVKHYLKNGTEHKGAVHKTKGMAMTGAKHTKSSKDLFHKKDLSPTAKKKANLT